MTDEITIESLTVKAFRGFPDERTFEFGSESAIVAGPNGTGKSTLFQAVEFLLTGDIAAMHGTGTRGVRLKRHLPNRKADPKETIVRAEFRDHRGETFEAYRRFTDRRTLVAERRPEEFERLIEVAERGLLLLTREELLELVISTAGNRKDEIYKLLDTSGIDERRKQLSRLAKEARGEAERQDDRRSEALSRLQAQLDDDERERVLGGDGAAGVDDGALLAAVNERRQNLGGEPLPSLSGADSFREGVTSPVEQVANPLGRDAVQRRIDRLNEWFGRATDVSADLSELAEQLRALQSDRTALASVSELSLVQQGRDLVSDTATQCPLCGRKWDSTNLQEHLAERENRLRRIENRTESIEGTASEVARDLEAVKSVLDRLLTDLESADVATDVAPLEEYRDRRVRGLLDRLDRDLVAEIDDVTPAVFETDLVDDAAVETVEALQTEAGDLPDRSALERDWDALETLANAYADWQEADTAATRYDRTAAEFEAAHRTFIRSRDAVTDDIFEDISQRFAEFYRALNPDESETGFDPKLDQKEAGVDFKVDFYGDGDHPPNALHSEGHQDLMGVGLFLTLVEQLSPLARAPVLLDDVVSVVDSDHRRRFAYALAHRFSDSFQCIVTTHDADWATELQDAGVADPAHTIEFDGWAPGEGPR